MNSKIPKRDGAQGDGAVRSMKCYAASLEELARLANQTDVRITVNHTGRIDLYDFGGDEFEAENLALDEAVKMLAMALAKRNENPAIDEPETYATLRACRDHWKVSWEHERENVIRLRKIISTVHGPSCVCVDCELVKQHNSY